MKKRNLTVIALLLVCTALAGTALADYGYTSVSGIPMAVDFTVRVDFDAEGMPHIVTDYPFETTGATEMNLVYNKGNNTEVLTLNYRHDTGVTRTGTLDTAVFSSAEKALQALRNGELTLDDQIFVNTSHFNKETDWLLGYSSREKNYVSYSERTNAQSFNGMGAGGTENSVYYRAGEIDSARTDKRTADADLVIGYDAYGEIEYAFINQYGNGYISYHYDPKTGLFNGHPITELGFDEADLTAGPIAALGTRTGTVTVPAPQVPAENSGTVFSDMFIVSMLAGIVLGFSLFRRFQRWRKAKKEQASRVTDGTGRTEKENEGPEPAPEEPEPLKTMSSSSQR